MKTVFNVLLVLVFLAYAAFVGVFFISPRLKLHLPFNTYIVQTGSMTPTLPVGSAIFTSKRSAYQVGDIVTFLPVGAKNTITHRLHAEVVKDGQTFFQTKGDANNSPDSELIKPSQIQGVVISHLPGIGRIVTAAKTPLGFSILVLLPCLIVIITEIIEIYKELLANERRKMQHAAPA